MASARRRERGGSAAARGERVGPWRLVASWGAAAWAPSTWPSATTAASSSGGAQAPQAGRRHGGDRSRRFRARAPDPRLARPPEHRAAARRRRHRRTAGRTSSMEYVEGEPIDALLRRDERPRRRASGSRCSSSVCDAVQHAHRNLVVHRDLKPSNILVTARGRGEAARLRHRQAARRREATPARRHAHRSRASLTPEYASPEQVRGEPVTTATDVYPLGAAPLRAAHRARARTRRAARVPAGAASARVCERLLRRDPAARSRRRRLVPPSARRPRHDRAAGAAQGARAALRLGRGPDRRRRAVPPRPAHPRPRATPGPIARGGSPRGTAPLSWAAASRPRSSCSRS